MINKKYVVAIVAIILALFGLYVYSWYDQESQRLNYLTQSTIITNPDQYNPSEVILDFSKCEKIRHSVSFGLGSVSFEVGGKTGDTCNFSYQEEIEMGLGLKFFCKVPINTPPTHLPITNYGMKTDTISQFCK